VPCRGANHEIIDRCLPAQCPWLELVPSICRGDGRSFAPGPALTMRCGRSGTQARSGSSPNRPAQLRSISKSAFRCVPKLGTISSP
jgi:hypothetical protein